MPLPDFHPRGAPADDDPEARAAWRISDDRQAEWVMRKLAASRQRVAEADRLRAEYQQQIDEWYVEATRRDQGDVAWATLLLQGWAHERRDADPDAKTLHLPSGTVASRWVPPRPEVRDPGAVAEALARAKLPSYDAIVRAHVQVDARGLAKVTQLADEYHVRLTCGCTPQVWHLGLGEPELHSGPWPWRANEHRCGASRPPAHLAAEGFDRGRMRQVVLVTKDPDGTERVHEVPGTSVAPGRLAVSVEPRGIEPKEAR